MKKFCISFVFIAIIILLIAIGIPKKSNEEYLRIHIRANSNSQEDQQIKIQVRDEVVKFLTPLLVQCDSKDEMVSMLNDNQDSINRLIDNFLLLHGFNYTAKTSIRTEEFPTRCYEDLTLEQGLYDAIIIELGEGAGDNWWCVVYPPLCFSTTSNVTYRSKINEIIESFKNNNLKEEK